MCANSAQLVNSLECYMDDLVDCFEDFVKKSLAIISVAVGALVLMLAYVLKMVAERPPPTITVTRAPAIDRTESGTTTNNSTTNYNPRYRAIDSGIYNEDSTVIRKSRSISSPQRSINNFTMPFTVKKDFRNTSANTGPTASVPCFNEKMLRNIGLTSASKSFTNTVKRPVVRNISTSRPILPNPQNCIPNRECPMCIYSIQNRGEHVSVTRPCSRYITSRNSCCSMCCAENDHH